MAKYIELEAKVLTSSDVTTADKPQSEEVAE